jgi:hypothetical protein
MSPSNKKNHGKPKIGASTPSRVPISAPPLDAPSPPSASATRVAFREFIELADLESIKHFLTAAASSPEGENLRRLWDRAFKEGLRVGHQLYVETVGKLNEVHNSGYEAGFEEGRREEQGDWIIDGHGEHCGHQPTVVHEDTGAQTDDDPKPTPPRSVTTMAVQVDAPNPIPPHHIKKTPPTPPRNTAESAVQTIQIGTQDTSSQTSPPHPNPVPNPTRTIPLPPAPLSWADDAASLPILSPPILPSNPPPRDLSILRSSSPNPFSSLQRRKNQPQARRRRERFSNPHQNFFYRHHFPSPHFSSTSFRSDRVYPRRNLHVSPSPTLNWEDDPRLLDLSQALKALGWVRR